MVEFINRNLENTKPEYFYRVSEFVTTFGDDPGKNEPIGHEENFKGADLLKCKKDAEKYYWERLKGLENGKYFLPFSSPRDFTLGENAAFSITLSLVEYYNEDKYYEHILFGEDEETIAEGRRTENEILNSL